MSLIAQVSSLLSTPVASLPMPARVGGWVTSFRKSKSVGFVMLSDGSSPQRLQVVVPQDLFDAHPELLKLTTSCAVIVEGDLVASMGSKQHCELKASRITVTGWVEDPEHYPIQPKEISAEFLRTIPHLRARVAQQGAIARLRHVLAQAIHEYFALHGFVWVATPIITSSDAEGAGSRFEVVADDPDFFGQPSYLTVSGQLAGEALCMALSRIYTFGPTFRAEPSQTSRHLAEFWMVEPEIAFAGLDDIMELSEGMLKHVWRAAIDRCSGDLDLLSQEEGLSVSQLQDLIDHPFVRITYTQAIELLQQSGEEFASSIVWGMDLQSEQEKWLVSHLGRPTFVTHYPQEIKSFYMRPTGDGKTVEAMDLLVPKMGELIGGSARADQGPALEKRMKELGMDVTQYQSYLDLRRYGSAPHAGFGLGFERLLAFISGAPSVRDVIAYPRYKGCVAE